MQGTYWSDKVFEVGRGHIKTKQNLVGHFKDLEPYPMGNEDYFIILNQERCSLDFNWPKLIMIEENRSQGIRLKVEKVKKFIGTPRLDKMAWTHSPLFLPNFSYKL